MSWARGAEAVFTADFATAGGGVVPLVSEPEVRILNPSLVQITSGFGTSLGDGQYKFLWTVPSDAVLGMWRVAWTGTSTDGIELSGEEWFEVTDFEPVIVGQYKDASVCSAWATEAELIAHCTSLQPVLAEIPDGTLSDALLAASDALYTMSGRTFTGLCQTTVVPSYTPSASRCAIPSSQTRINLGLWPVHSVVSVSASGSVVDPATYELEDYKYLRFTGEIPSGIKAVVQYGMPAPLLGKRACLALACEMLAAFFDDDNALPGGVATSISRQGITEDTINPEDLLENGRTGIYEVDRFLMVYNPAKVPSPSFIISSGTVASEHLPVEYSWPYGR